MSTQLSPQLTHGGVPAMTGVLRRCHRAARRGGPRATWGAKGSHMGHREAAHPHAGGQIVQSPVAAQPGRADIALGLAIAWETAMLR